MGPIKDISGISQNLKKLEKQGDTRKIDSNKDAGKVSKGTQATSENDKAEISDAGRTLLSAKTESVKFIDQVRNTRTLSEAELQDIKDKVDSGYYFDKKIEEKIAERLLELPNFLDNPNKNLDEDQEQLNA